MVNTIFHYASHLKFVFICWGCLLVYIEMFNPTEHYVDQVGMGLLLCGLGMSFEGLRDDKRAGKLNKKIYQKEKLTKTFLVIWTTMFFLEAILGLYFIFLSQEQQLGYGILTFAVGGINLMKMEYNRFCLHRKKQELITSDGNTLAPE